MRSFYILSFFICLSVLVACKKDTPAQQESATVSSASVPDSTIVNPPRMESTNSGPQNPSVAPKSDPAKANAKGEVDTNLGHDYTFLTFKMFKINGAFVPGKDPKDQPYKDQWVDFLPDGTFKWGKGKDLMYTGAWGYNHEVGILDMKPNDKNQPQTEWKVIFNDDMVVMTGTSTFNNNGVQLQLIRIASVD